LILEQPAENPYKFDEYAHGLSINWAALTRQPHD
jgi:hypothetical protein